MLAVILIQTYFIAFVQLKVQKMELGHKFSTTFVTALPLKHIQNVQHEHGIQNVQHGYKTSHVVLAVGASGDCFF